MYEDDTFLLIYGMTVNSETCLKTIYCSDPLCKQRYPPSGTYQCWSIELPNSQQDADITQIVAMPVPESAGLQNITTVVAFSASYMGETSIVYAYCFEQSCFHSIVVTSITPFDNGYFACWTG
jgi:hypothetical protein